MNKAIILQSSSDYWEGLFVNGALVEEGHTLNQGEKRIQYLKKLANKYGFDLNDLDEHSVTDEYDEIMEDQGGFHTRLEDVQYV